MVVQHILALRKGRREIKTEITTEKEKVNPKIEDSNDKCNVKSTDNETDVESTDGKNNFNEEKLVIKEEVEEDVGKSISQPEQVEENEIVAPEENKENDNANKGTEEDTEVSTVGSKDTSETGGKFIEVEEFFVKYRNFSYLHCEWKTEQELFKGDKRIIQKIKRFKQKLAHNTNIFENVSNMKLH